MKSEPVASIVSSVTETGSILERSFRRGMFVFCTGLLPLSSNLVVVLSSKTVLGSSQSCLEMTCCVLDSTLQEYFGGACCVSLSKTIKIS